MVLTAAVIAAAVGGERTSGAPDQVIDGFSIDSRSLASGDLFFAIVAARDGHEFVADALGRGAAGTVVRVGFEFDAGPGGQSIHAGRALPRAILRSFRSPTPHEHSRISHDSCGASLAPP